jgi:hypothetical protein
MVHKKAIVYSALLHGGESFFPDPTTVKNLSQGPQHPYRLARARQYLHQNPVSVLWGHACRTIPHGPHLVYRENIPPNSVEGIVVSSLLY